MQGQVRMDFTRSTPAPSCSLPAHLDEGLLLVHFTAKEHMCGVDREDDSDQGLSAGVLCHVHILLCQDTRYTRCPPGLQERGCGRAKNR